MMLDRYLELHVRARLKMGRHDVGEREILLEQGRPATAGRVADLLSILVYRRARSPSDRRQLGREPRSA